MSADKFLQTGRKRSNVNLVLTDDSGTAAAQRKHAIDKGLQASVETSLADKTAHPIFESFSYGGTEFIGMVEMSSEIQEDPSCIRIEMCPLILGQQVKRRISILVGRIGVGSKFKQELNNIVRDNWHQANHVQQISLVGAPVIKGNETKNALPEKMFLLLAQVHVV